MGEKINIPTRFALQTGVGTSPKHFSKWPFQHDLWTVVYSINTMLIEQKLRGRVAFTTIFTIHATNSKRQLQNLAGAQLVSVFCEHNYMRLHFIFSSLFLLCQFLFALIDYAMKGSLKPFLGEPICSFALLNEGTSIKIRPLRCQSHCFDPRFLNIRFCWPNSTSEIWELMIFYELANWCTSTLLCWFLNTRTHMWIFRHVSIREVLWFGCN